LAKGDFGEGIDECLLIQTANALYRADIVRILSSEIPRMLSFDLPRGLLAVFGTLKGFD
jgi:hypothetical protein